jgi:hypothetical protein
VAAEREQLQAPEGERDAPAAPALVPAHGNMLDLASLVGNQAFTAIARNPASAGRLLREPTATADPTTPASVPPELEREWTIELRRRAGDRMGLAFTKYRAAIATVQKEMEDRKAQPTLFEQLLAIAVGYLAPGVANMVLSRIRDQLKEIASTAIEAASKAMKAGDEQAIKAYMNAEALVDKYVSLDGSQAKAGFLSMTASIKQQAAGGPPQPAATMLAKFSEDFSVYLDELNAKVGSAPRHEVLGVFAAFDPAMTKESLYAAQIRDLVAKHEEVTEYARNEQLGTFGSSFDFRRIILLEAWGVKKPAYIKYSPLSIMAGKKAYWYFEKWVPEDVAATAIAAGQGQTKGGGGPMAPTHLGLEEVKAGDPYPEIKIQGHIDNPRSEGPRIVEIDAWGKVRLCNVDVQADGGKFLSWVDNEEFARIQAARQPGGLVRMEADKITDKKAPKG